MRECRSEEKRDAFICGDEGAKSVSVSAAVSPRLELTVLAYEV